MMKISFLALLVVCLLTLDLIHADGKGDAKAEAGKKPGPPAKSAPPGSVESKAIFFL